ncbi:MAG: capsule assembly Wzi family protein [Fibrobacter sp.]|nr:capsule assembly Wzi family protein [Fibrobacter sp.]
MLFELHRTTTGEGRQFFAFPRRDTSFRASMREDVSESLLGYDNVNGAFVLGHDNSVPCGESDTACIALAKELAVKHPRIAVAMSLVGGMDYRGGEALGDTIWPSIDGGIYLRGYADSVDFELDARIYDEGHSADRPKSFDGEFLEVQREENNSGLEYTSYARYRAHFAFNYDWFRLDFARDVMHWGPGYYNNLTLNQFALPYNMVTMDLQFGPLRVTTFYADLRIYNSMSMKNKDENRNLFGHRYELAAGNATIGVSELQVQYDNLKPWLFMPAVPLFMEKGNYSEDSNNGSLSFDFNYRLFNAVRFYTEFFLDDMESPVSLVNNDNIEAKWAWMAGIHGAQDFTVNGHLLEVGSIAEYARIEPYVYSHFTKNTAQMAHLGRPIGNQNGPNSQVIDWTLYGRLDRHIFASLRHTWYWKGTDYGSAVNDTTPRVDHMKIHKKFLDGAKMEYSLTPSISYEGQFVSYMGEITLINDKKVYLRAGFKW